jgi:hypothetical protein
MLCIGYAQSVPDEGSASVEATPHPSSLREDTLSHKGRAKETVVPRAHLTSQLCHISAAPFACYALARAHKTRFNNE